MKDTARRGWTRWIAFAASFSVYLLPVFFRHSIGLWGQALFVELTQGRTEQEAAWVLADLGFAILIQVAAGLLFYWLFRRPSWSRLALLITAVPFFGFLVPLVYLAVIPSHFLIEADTAAEKGTWSAECSIPGTYLLAPRSPVDLALEKAEEAWVRTRSRKLAILRMPGCKLREFNVELGWTGVDFAVPGGTGLFARVEPPSTKVKERWYQRGPEGARQAVEIPPGCEIDHRRPILSSDGGWIACIVSEISDTGGIRATEVYMQHLPDRKEKRVNLNGLGIGQFELLALDVDSEQVILARNLYDIFAMGLDGTVRWGPLTTAIVRPSPWTFRFFDPGWVVWDLYREDGPPRVAWKLPAGSGMHTVLKGRGISSVAVDTTGHLLAVGVHTALSIGNTRSAVYVLAARDGTEVFRKYFPEHTKPTITFLGSRYFAYSDGSGVHIFDVAQGLKSY